MDLQQEKFQQIYRKEVPMHLQKKSSDRSTEKAPIDLQKKVPIYLQKKVIMKMYMKNKKAICCEHIGVQNWRIFLSE